MKKGFTLVELSVVLIIIGLLVSGLLIIQAITESGKRGALISQLQQYDISMSNFKEKFNQIPGDSDLMTPAGNNNGQIRDGGNDDNSFTGEMSYFWAHLSQTELQGAESYSETTATGIIPDVNVPRARYGKGANVGIFIGWPLNATDPFYNAANVFWITGLPTTTTNTWGGACGGCSYPFKGEELYAIDIKMDDGLARDGNVQCASAAEFGTCNASCASGDVYDVDETVRNCSFVVKTLTSGGR